MGGGILYNKKIYADLGLSVPKSWAEFMANNEKIKAAGKAPVIQTFGDTWTSQLFVLADYYNVQAAVPDFAEKYTANQAKYATTPAALKGFQRQEEVFKAGYLNEDFAAAKFDDGLRMVATGEGAHYPMLTFAIGGIAQNYPGQPQGCRLLRHARRRRRLERPDGLDAGGGLHRQDHPASRGGQELRRVHRQHQGLRHPQRGQRRHRSVPDQGLHAAGRRAAGRRRPAAVLPEETGATAPALEFLSPIKGPALEQITVEVGSGIRPAADGAALYDEDVKKQAQQLGLPGW